MLKIFITPSFHSPGLFELKKDRDHFVCLFTKDAFEKPHDPGFVRVNNSPDQDAVENLLVLADRIIDYPTRFGYVTINDGIGTRLLRKRDGKEYDFCAPPDESGEELFIRFMLRLLRQNFPDAETTAYVGELENYYS